MDKPKFGMTWKGLKLLGKHLYSHPWSAVSELVANGIDAEAQTIKIHLDRRSGKDAVNLEVLDDGHGMNQAAIQNYVKIGFNKRDSVPDSIGDRLMGRKGIGKLAALYLSNSYNLLTKVAPNQFFCYYTDVENQEDESEPELTPIDLSDPSSPIINSDLYQEWVESQHGTLIQIPNIDLQGYGNRAFEALETRLGQHFLTDSLGTVNIQLLVTEKGATTRDFKEVVRETAFKNLLTVKSNFSESHIAPKGFAEIKPGSSIKIEYKRQPRVTQTRAGQFVEHENGEQKQPLSGHLEANPEIEYQLTGWLGLHSSIATNVAMENDNRFIKNQFYNPCKIRLYVRNKLAMHDVMPLLKQASQTYSNYIEGEISFDVLDDSRLPDIATTSREGFDRTDSRVELLVTLLETQVQALIEDRKKVTEKLATEDEKLEKEKQKRSFRAKKTYLNNIESALKANDVSIEQSVNVMATVRGGLETSETEVDAKKERMVFLSHASRSRYISNLVQSLLLRAGAEQREIFYTSNSDIPENERFKALAERIRDSLLTVGTKPAYFVSTEFRDSEYCLFEAGAGWATRDRAEYELLATRFEEAPEFLVQGTQTVPLLDDRDEIVINRDTYSEILRVTNSLIDHLNEGRVIQGRTILRKYDLPQFPTEHEMARSNSEDQDFMDQEIVDDLKILQGEWRKNVVPYRRSKKI